MIKDPGKKHQQYTQRYVFLSKNYAHPCLYRQPNGNLIIGTHSDKPPVAEYYFDGGFIFTGIAIETVELFSESEQQKELLAEYHRIIAEENSQK